MRVNSIRLKQGECAAILIMGKQKSHTVIQSSTTSNLRGQICLDYRAISAQGKEAGITCEEEEHIPILLEYDTD